jgi:hypothetical protein
MRGTPRTTVSPIIFLTLLVGAAACVDDIPVTSPEEVTKEEVTEPAGSQNVVASVTCTAKVTAGELSCGKVPVVDEETGLQRIIVGGQGVFVQLVSSGVSYDPGTEIFQADVQVGNLLGDDPFGNPGVGLQLGTPDEIQITGVRVFYHSLPTVRGGTGSATVRNADSTGTFTGSNQPYYKYDAVIPPGFITNAKIWEWDVTSTVDSFDFEVFVQADVPHPNGFVQVSPEAATSTIGGNVPIAASIRDHVNRVVAGAIAFSTADPSIATVDPVSGLVSGVGPGTVDIIASSGGSEADGVTKIMISEPGYQIRLRYLTAVTATQQQAFDSAVTRWQSHLTGDLADVTANTQGVPECGGGPINEDVDDLVIRVTLDSIDGPGMILGQAGPCLVRSNGLPGFGTMTFDTADVALLVTNMQLVDVVVHEMGHVLGLGTRWGALGLLLGGGTADPRFTGAAAIAAYIGVGGAGALCNPPTINTVCVPVEGTGGPGTRDAHWREDQCATCQTTDFFGNELMTGFISAPGNPNPLSVVSIDHFTDLGYPGVNNAGADPFTLNTSLRALETAGPRLKLVDDIWLGPVHRIEEDGTLTLVVPDRR